jgi:hypothetical protein
MKQKLFFFILPLLIVSLELGGSTLAEAVEPLSLTHSLKSYSSDGPNMTLLLSLTLQNNGKQTMKDIFISLSPMPKFHVESIEEQTAMAIGTLSPGEKGYVEYSLTSSTVYPKDEIEFLPMFWEIKYTDESMKEMVEIIMSQRVAKGGAK